MSDGQANDIIARLNATVGALDQRLADSQTHVRRLTDLLKEIESAYFGRCADDAPALARAVGAIRVALAEVKP